MFVRKNPQMLDLGPPLNLNEDTRTTAMLWSQRTLLETPMFCSNDSHSLKKNHESIASARSIRGFFTRRRVTLGKPAIQNAYQFKTPISQPH